MLILEKGNVLHLKELNHLYQRIFYDEYILNLSYYLNRMGKNVNLSMRDGMPVEGLVSKHRSFPYLIPVDIFYYWNRPYMYTY